MRIFLTGATGFIGSVVLQELISAGHQVLGLARTDVGASSVLAAGADVHRGAVEDVASLRRGAAACDGVVHTAFIHEFSKFQENCEIDRRAIEAMGAEIAGSDRRLVITSGTGVAATPGRLTSEDDAPNSPMPRVASEQAAAVVAARGGTVISVRLPQVHDPVKQGLITYLVAHAREKGVSAYIDDGSNRWAAVHRMDAARLYRLALENGIPGARYNAVGEEGVSMRQIAEAIARGLKIPAVSLPQESAAAHFGWLAMFVGHDMPASSALTQQRLGWRPTGPGLIEDLDRMQYTPVG